MTECSSPIWTHATTERYHTGTWRDRTPEYGNPPAPCQGACPVAGNIALWVQQAREQDYHGAWLTLVRNNPFPAIAGRVCHHPCEAACNRGNYDEPIAVRALERFLGDEALARGWSLPPAPPAGEASVAIIGAGPAGLSAACHLRRRGHAVTLFEARPEAGGLLRYGIPAYRLPREVLDGEIARVLGLGVELRAGVSVTSAAVLANLRGRFAALYLATGADSPKRLPEIDYAQPWVMDGSRFLEQVNAGGEPRVGRRVLVVGGGSSAMDVARTARRLGRDVTLLSLEPEASLPCQREEVVDGKAEGITLIDGARLRAVHAGGAAGLRVDCERVRCDPGEAAGERTPAPVADSVFTLAADSVVTAIGQDPGLAELRGALASDGPLIHVDEHQQTSLAGVFAGGDLASMSRFVTHAIGMGRRAAEAIDRRLRPGAARERGRPVNRYRRQAPGASAGDWERPVAPEAVNISYHEHAARSIQPRLPPAERVAGFAEVQRGLDLAGATAEAGRCFSCGSCIFCDNCLYHCPDMAIRRIRHGYVVDGDYCKGCGLCVRECPTGAIRMLESGREAGPATR